MSTALVTGGGTRLGRAFCEHLATKGFDIAIHYNSSITETKIVKERVEALGVSCGLFEMDFTRFDSYAGLIEQVAGQFPDLNLLVNSASLYHQFSIRDTKPQVFDSQFQVNLKAPFFLTQAFAERIEAKEGNGSVINIIDNKVAFNQYHYAAYLLTKKSLEDFTRMAALELAPRIRVNGISPGVVMPMASRTSDYLDWRIQGIPLKRQGTVSDLTRAMDYLLESPFVTGQILTADGGESLANSGRNAGEFDGQ